MKKIISKATRAAVTDITVVEEEDRFPFVLVSQNQRWVITTEGR
jgi:hypothetical protein